MKEAYKNMRHFWLDATNLDNRKGVLEIGPEKIVAAGLEMPFEDGKTVKYVFLGTNSLGDSSFYFENNSPSGLGGVIGGHGNEKLQTAAAHMLAYAAKLASQMECLPAGQELPACAVGNVCLVAVSKDKLFYKQLPESDARNTENPFYPMYAYAQQTVGFFREQQAQNPAHA